LLQTGTGRDTVTRSLWQTRPHEAVEQYFCFEHFMNEDHLWLALMKALNAEQVGKAAEESGTERPQSDVLEPTLDTAPLQSGS
jgi:ribonuclease D